MATAPYGVRLLVGAAVTAIEETRKLPQTILMYPMTVASQVAHLVMKMQQDVADLVIKGDEMLDQLFPPKEEQPEWATFDEDLDDDQPGQAEHRRRTPDRGPLRAVHRRRAGHRRSQAGQGGEAGRRRPARRRRRAGLRVAHAGPAAGPAVVAARRRPRGAAGLRRRHQVARTVPDPAGQQDHPRDRQVTSSEQGQSPENPWPVRAVATRVAKWIDRLGTVWVEGQLDRDEGPARIPRPCSWCCATRPPTCR